MKTRMDASSRLSGSHAPSQTHHSYSSTYPPPPQGSTEENKGGPTLVAPRVFERSLGYKHEQQHDVTGMASSRGLQQQQLQYPAPPVLDAAAANSFFASVSGGYLPGEGATPSAASVRDAEKPPLASAGHQNAVVDTSGAVQRPQSGTLSHFQGNVVQSSVGYSKSSFSSNAAPMLKESGSAATGSKGPDCNVMNNIANNKTAGASDLRHVHAPGNSSRYPHIGHGSMARKGTGARPPYGYPTSGHSSVAGFGVSRVDPNSGNAVAFFHAPEPDISTLFTGIDENDSSTKRQELEHKQHAQVPPQKKQEQKQQGQELGHEYEHDDDDDQQVQHSSQEQQQYQLLEKKHQQQLHYEQPDAHPQQQRHQQPQVAEAGGNTLNVSNHFTSGTVLPPISAGGTSSGGGSSSAMDFGGAATTGSSPSGPPPQVAMVAGSKLNDPAHSAVLQVPPPFVTSSASSGGPVPVQAYAIGGGRYVGNQTGTNNRFGTSGLGVPSGQAAVNDRQQMQVQQATGVSGHVTGTQAQTMGDGVGGVETYGVGGSNGLSSTLMDKNMQGDTGSVGRRQAQQPPRSANRNVLPALPRPPPSSTPSLTTAPRSGNSLSSHGRSSQRSIPRFKVPPPLVLPKKKTSPMVAARRATPPPSSLNSLDMMSALTESPSLSLRYGVHSLGAAFAMTKAQNVAASPSAVVPNVVVPSGGGDMHATPIATRVESDLVADGSGRDGDENHAGADNASKRANLLETVQTSSTRNASDNSLSTDPVPVDETRGEARGIVDKTSTGQAREDDISGRERLGKTAGLDSSHGAAATGIESLRADGNSGITVAPEEELPDASATQQLNSKSKQPLQSSHAVVSGHSHVGIAASRTACNDAGDGNATKSTSGEAIAVVPYVPTLEEPDNREFSPKEGVKKDLESKSKETNHGLENDRVLAHAGYTPGEACGELRGDDLKPGENIGDSSNSPPPPPPPIPEYILPAEWSEYPDSSTGRVYYYNATTGETTWERPSFKVESTGALADAGLNGEDKVVAPEDDVPEKEETEVNFLRGDSGDGTLGLAGGERDVDLMHDRATTEAATHHVFSDSNIPTANSIESSAVEFHGVAPELDVPVTRGSDDTHEDEQVAHSLDLSSGDADAKGTHEITPDGTRTEETKTPVTLTQSTEERSLKEEATSAVSLPPGWEEVLDSVSEQVFYYNRDTGETTWEKPELRTEGGASTLGEVPEVVQDGLDGVTEMRVDGAGVDEDSDIAREKGPESMLESDGKDGMEDVGVVEAAFEEVCEEASTPITDVDIGEREQMDGESVSLQEHQRAVICDHHDLPQNQTESQRAAQLEKDEVLRKDAVAEDLQEERDLGKTVSLPPGWFEAFDDSTKQLYYYNEETGESSWIKPHAPLTNGDETSSASQAGHATKESVNTSNEHGNATKENIKMHEESIVRSVDTEVTGESQVGTVGVFSVRDEANDPVSAALSPESSSAQKSPRFSVTQGRSEERMSPNKDILAKVAGTDASCEQYADPSTCADREISSGQGEDPAEDGNEESCHTLPLGWVEAWDEANQKPYFYNTETGQSSWERPMPPVDARENILFTGGAGLQATEPRNSLKNDLDGEKQPSDGKMAMLISTPEATAPPIVDGKNDHGEGSIGIDGSQVKTSTAPQDKRDREAVNANGNNDTTDASAKHDVTEQRNAGMVVPDSSSEASLTNGREKEQENNLEFEQQIFPENERSEQEVQPLPDGWVEAFDEGTRMTYFWNEADGQTTWTRPVAGSLLTKTAVAEVMAENEFSIEKRVGRTIDASTLQASDALTKKNNVDERCDPGNIVYEPQPSGSRDLNVTRQVGRPAHALVSFGFGGRLCVTLPHPKVSPHTAGSAALSARTGVVYLFRLYHVVDPHVFSLPDVSKGDFVGPWNSASESSVWEYLKHKSEEQEEESSDTSKQSSQFLWKLIQVAAVSKGRLRSSEGASNPHGAEAAIVKLLLGNNENELSHVGFDASAVPENLHKNSPDEEHHISASESMNAAQTLLLRGKREEAVQVALAGKQYGLALLVASFCDQKTYQSTTRKFAEEAIKGGSPLHTLVMLFSGQLQISNEDRTLLGPRILTPRAFWEASCDDLPRNWRFHLATILNNRTQGWDKVVRALGDQLVLQGCVAAGHFCYMVGGCPVTAPSPTCRLVLVGCDCALPMHAALMTREGVESYERTEAFEWAKRRGNRDAAIPALQEFKLLYAKLLADFGWEKWAFSYIKSIRSCTGLKGEGEDSKAGIVYSESFVEALRVFEDRVSVSIGDGLSIQKKNGNVPNSLKDVTSVSTMISPLLTEKVEGASAQKDSFVLNSVDAAKQDMKQGSSSRDSSAVLSPLPSESVSHGEKAEKDFSSSIINKLSEYESAPTRTPMEGTAPATINDNSAPKELAQREGFVPKNSFPVPEHSDGPGHSSNPSLHQSAAMSPPATVGVGTETLPPVVDSSGGEETLVSKSECRPADKLAGIRSAPPSIGKVSDGSRAKSNDTPGMQTAKAPPKSEGSAVLSKPRQAPSSGNNSRQAPTSGNKPGWLKSLLLGKLHPDAAIADLGEDNKAYYDKNLGRWIFPGDDPDEVAKPLAPPPIIPSKVPESQSSEPQEQSACNDPLSALMAPPSRMPAKLSSSRSRYPDPLANMGAVSNAANKKSSNGDTGPTDNTAHPPQFHIFQPAAQGS